ncbi:MAG: HD domain-containing protein [Elusimicrobiota bacterium]|jgi:putative nucleotidyltransferase with HDIG domain|nr:HD domain-containing protein [Elusimicrobiota bacterium]
MTKQEALSLLKQYVKNENMIRHCIASGAVLYDLAQKLGCDKELWQAAGILHDIDVELVGDDIMKNHGTKAREILKDKLDEQAIAAIEAHNEHANIRARSTTFDHALAAGETITGLITATAYVYPDRKVSSVKPKSIIKRMKEKNFAASVNRNTIMECEKIGIPLQEFTEISLSAMQNAAEELGL